jgi:hypothetical protein
VVISNTYAASRLVVVVVVVPAALSFLRRRLRVRHSSNVIGSRIRVVVVAAVAVQQAHQAAGAGAKREQELEQRARVRDERRRGFFFSHLHLLLLDHTRGLSFVPSVVALIRGLFVDALLHRRRCRRVVFALALMIRRFLGAMLLLLPALIHCSCSRSS